MRSATYSVTLSRISMPIMSIFGNTGASPTDESTFKHTTVEKLLTRCGNSFLTHQTAVATPNVGNFHFRVRCRCICGCHELIGISTLRGGPGESVLPQSLG